MSETLCECPDCGSEQCKMTRYSDQYKIGYECPDCGYDDFDSDEDFYGPMSVPWGFLL